MTFNFDLNHDLDLGFSRSIFKKVISGMGWPIDGRFHSLGMKGMRVGYDVECTMGLTLGHGAWQIDWPSNGSMWNSYSFQPVGQWMGYLFTELGAEGCCRSLNALLNMFFGLHVEHMSCVIKNCDQHQWAIPSFFLKALYRRAANPSKCFIFKGFNSPLYTLSLECQSYIYI